VLFLQYKDFTLDPNNFPLSKMTQLVEDLHNRSMQYGEVVCVCVCLCSVV